MLQLPNVTSCMFRNPWLKNFPGVANFGFMSRDFDTRFVWIDQNLKEDMTGKR